MNKRAVLLPFPLVLLNVIVLSQAWIQKADIGHYTTNSPEMVSSSATFEIDGYIYLACGISAGNATATLWRFDPETENWEQKADINGPARRGATAFVLNGKGYVMGGQNGNTILNDTWEYDPANDNWSPKADLPMARVNAVSYTIGNKGFVCTGWSGSELLNDHWSYDPLTNEWSPLADFPGAARHGAVTFNLDGKAYVTTGSAAQGAITTDLWEYDPIDDGWIEREAFPAFPRAGGIAFVLNGTGMVGTGFYNNELYAYDPIMDSWSIWDTLPGPQMWDGSAVTVGDEAYIFMGRYFNKAFFHGWRFSSEWERIPGMGGVPHSGSVAFTANEEGYTWTGRPDAWNHFSIHTDVWRYSPATDSWSINSSHNALQRFGTTCFQLNGTAHLLFGEIPQIGESSLANTLSYDVAEGQLTADTIPPSYRTQATSFTIGDKGYLTCGIASWYQENSELADLWEYDPVDSSWSEKASLPANGRYGPIAFAINGKGYLIAGRTTDLGPNCFNEVWEYDPPLDTWTQKAPFPGPELCDRSIGIAIGDRGYISIDSLIWSYDPALDLWQPHTPPPRAFDYRSFAFTIGNKGYFGGGGNGEKFFYEYSPSDDDITTEMHGADIGNRLHFYPNPANEQLVIELAKQVSGHASVKIYDALGALHFEQNISTGQDRHIIPIDRLVSGAYVLHIQQGSALSGHYFIKL